jgi:hypothetical protein
MGPWVYGAQGPTVQDYPGCYWSAAGLHRHCSAVIDYSTRGRSPRQACTGSVTRSLASRTFAAREET